LKEERHGGQAVFEEQKDTLRLSEHKSRRKRRETAGVQEIKTAGMRVIHKRIVPF